MAIKLQKIKDVEYNELITLVLLYKEKKLWALFKDEFGIPFPMLLTICKNNGMSKKAQETLRAFFDEVVLTESTILPKYENLLKTFDDKELEKFEKTEVKTAEIVTPVTTSEPVIKEVKPEKTAEIVAEKKKVEESAKADKKKPNRKLPRRIGKEAIEKAIKDNGGKSTQLQRLMLRLNDLKNIYVKLNNRGIKEMHVNDGSILSDYECRTINSAITILEQKVDDILKKK